MSCEDILWFSISLADPNLLNLKVLLASLLRLPVNLLFEEFPLLPDTNDDIPSNSNVLLTSTINGRFDFLPCPSVNVLSSYDTFYVPFFQYFD